MRLNLDCIRDILLYVEEVATPRQPVFFDSDGEFQVDSALCKYSLEEVQYHLNQCNLSGFFLKPNLDFGGCWIVIDLTPKGHEYLGSIRDSSNWKTVKERAAKIGVTTLNAAFQIANAVITEKITKGL